MEEHRLNVKIPEVLGDDTTAWAKAAPDLAAASAVPDIGTEVWIEFEGVQLECGAGGAKPLVGPGRALLAAGGLDDHPGQPGTAGGQQRVGVGVAFPHRQVGVAELASQWRHRHELTDSVLDASLVAGGRLGQPVTGAHPTVQRRPWGIR
jgi:hypothetical protein